jgi:hypothetical protein
MNDPASHMHRGVRQEQVTFPGTHEGRVPAGKIRQQRHVGAHPIRRRSTDRDFVFQTQQKSPNPVDPENELLPRSRRRVGSENVV